MKQYPHITSGYMQSTYDNRRKPEPKSKNQNSAERGLPECIELLRQICFVLFAVSASASVCVGLGGSELLRLDLCGLISVQNALAILI